MSTKKKKQQPRDENAPDIKKIIEGALKRMLQYELDWKTESAKGIDLLLQLSNTSIEQQFVNLQ